MDQGPDLLIIKAKVPLQAALSGLIGHLSCSLQCKSQMKRRIPPEQKPKENSPNPSAMPASRKIQQKGPEDYERDKVGKYAQYFQRNVILPIPEVSKAQEPRILSLVITDLKTGRLTGLKKDTFEEVFLTAGILCQYFCRRSFTTWDVFLRTEKQVAKIQGSNIMTKFFRL